MKTEKEPRPMRGLHLVGGEGNGPASTPYGPVKVGLTTTHRTQLLLLSELLNSLEKDLEILQSKLCEAYATSMYVMGRLAVLSPIIKEKDTTD